MKTLELIADDEDSRSGVARLRWSCRAGWGEPMPEHRADDGHDACDIEVAVDDERPEPDDDQGAEQCGGGEVVIGQRP